MNSPTRLTALLAIILIGLLRASASDSYRFIHPDSISLNGADWSALRQKAAVTDSARLHIVHIGDSHIQADIMTGQIRRALTRRLGSSGGRGTMAPLAACHTNQPVDYRITASAIGQTSTMFKRDKPFPQGFLGATFDVPLQKFDLDIACTSYPFDHLTVYHSDNIFFELLGEADGVPMPIRVESIDGASTIALPEAVSSLTLQAFSADTPRIGGVFASLGCSGLIYSAIGANGATFATTLDAIAQRPGLTEIPAPDLVIVSLGTNDAFGRFDGQDVADKVAELIAAVRDACPNALIMLTTPMECQKPLRRSRKRRRTYAVNPNVAKVAEVVRQTARREGVALLDLYNIAGGAGSSARWLSNGLLSKDRVHLTHKGYILTGDIVAESLIQQLTSK